jgi:F1F0 ATPase subunit 2
MNDWLFLLLMFLSGVLLGITYLAALWLTVQHLQHGRRPALWLITSLLLRMLLLVAAFYLILGNGHWQHLLAALAGFMTLRILTIHTVRRQGLNTKRDKEEPV